MLSIYVHSATDPGFLDIPDGATLDMESPADAFQFEEGQDPEFSLPIDIQWTDHNRRLLGFAERLENFNRLGMYWIVTVYDRHFPVMVKAKMTLLNKAGKFDYRSGKFSVSITGTRGIFATRARNTKLADLPLGGVITFPLGMDSREFANWHHTEGYTQYPGIRFAPVGWPGFYDQERFDFDGEFLAKDTVNNVVQLSGGGWTFGRPTVADPATPADPLSLEYLDYRTVPFYTLKFLLEKVFTDLGYRVTGECFTNPDFDNLVLFNNYAIERYNAGFTILTSRDENNRINPANHVPDMLVADFIKTLLPGLGIFPSFVDDTNVVLIFHRTNISQATVATVDDVLVDQFECTYPEATAAESGYKIALADDPDDQYYSERVKDVSQKTLVSRVGTRADLDDITSGTLTTSDMVYVEAENMYYSPADTTADPMLWDAFAEALDDYVSGKGDKQVDLSFSTLAQYVILDPDTQLYTNQGYLGTRQKGSYVTNKGVLVKNSFGLRLFYCSAPGASAPAPYSYNHNRDAENTVTEKFSFALQREDSLAQLLIPWLNIQQNASVVKVQLTAHPELMERLRRHKKLQTAGVVSFTRKILWSVPLGNTVTVELVPL